MNRTLFIALTLLAGCGNLEKAPADDTFTELAGADDKSDKFTGKMTIVGSINYGEKQGPFAHAKGKWSALKFAGDAGDQITADVISSDGDTVAWVLDNDFNILGYNDDFGGGTNSHIELTLPKNASRTHYIVTRDYYRGAMHFTVGLQGKSAVSFDAPCNVDSDCALVRPDCCSIQNPIGVRADQVAAYRASLGCPAHQICPAIAIRNNHASAECLANKCVAVLPADVNCGGRSLNPHSCPATFVCEGPQLAVDGTGKCFQQCGGIAGLGCDGVDQICVDNPNDSCDPANGGADCIGECRDAICSGATARCAAGYHWDQFQCNCVENSFCGGIAGFPCPAGKSCVDNPNDNCDPAKGGADCGGICVVEHWYFTCGTPVCHVDSTDPAYLAIPVCSGNQVDGNVCASDGDFCRPAVYSCGRVLKCQQTRPVVCPISQRDKKRDIQYLDDAGRARYYQELLGIKLATYQYKEAAPTSSRRLGFIIEDTKAKELVDEAREHVDLYGYSSMAVAAVQTQARELAALKAEVQALKQKLAELTGKKLSSR